jgi:hypothetical protein
LRIPLLVFAFLATNASSTTFMAPWAIVALSMGSLGRSTRRRSRLPYHVSIPYHRMKRARPSRLIASIWRSH